MARAVWRARVSQRQRRMSVIARGTGAWDVRQGQWTMALPALPSVS
jgi:hypothetical protein